MASSVANGMQSGGLLLLQQGEEPGFDNASDNQAERRQRSSQSQNVGRMVSGGRDPAGFMRVFVVRGGVNTSFNPTGGR